LGDAPLTDEIVVPPEFAQLTVRRLGRVGRQWLDELPSVVAGLADRWGLEIGSPFGLSYGYVVHARRRDGTPVVLKIQVPDDEVRGEIVALRLYDGRGACRLLDLDESLRALLLEAVVPGSLLVALAEQDDQAATVAGARLMRDLWRPIPVDVELKPISGWFADAFAAYRQEYGPAGPIPRDFFERGQQVATELLGSAEHAVLLHGDFHHFNVLKDAGRGWLAIDPKGVEGDPGYDAGPFLLNPDAPVGKTGAELARRLDILAVELEYDRARLRDWGIAHALLSACWSAERGGSGWRQAIDVGRRLTEL
jgi:streptomycin 6-kinase